MTDHHDEYDEVRRLLGDARHDEPIPTDVADRLDRVLAQLAAGEPVPGDEGSAERAPLVDLATRRRRARARNVLVAAAAVVAVGVGFSQLDLTMSGSSGDGAASVSADEEGAPASGGDSALESDSDSSTLDEREGVGTGTDRERSASQLNRSRLVVTDSDFAVVASRQARKARNGVGLPLAESASAVPDVPGAPVVPQDGLDHPSEFDSGSSSYQYTANVCGPGPYGDGSLFLVTYRRHPAVLAVRPREGDSTVVDLLRCGSGEVLRSSTVPTPRDR